MIITLRAQSKFKESRTIIVDNPETFLHLTATGWTAIASIGSAVSVFVLVVSNIFYLRAMNRQVAAANEQAAAATQALRLAEDSNRIAQQAVQQQRRPWVGLDDHGPGAVMVGTVKIDQNGAASAAYSIRVKNFGDAPAQSVLATASLMITEDLQDIQTEQEQLSKPNGDPTIGLLLFPTCSGNNSKPIVGSPFGFESCSCSV